MAATWGIALSPAHQDQFAAYAAELQQWNQRINLTAITTSDDIVVRHFLDSLRCILAWGHHPPRTLIDVGTGAGFPGLPLKILYPDLQLVLVESTAKKTRFLQHIVHLLALADVTILHARAEAVGADPSHREQYDVVTARAVSELRVLLEYTLPLARVGGRVLAPKGGAVEEECAAAQQALALLGGTLQAVEPVLLPGLEPRTLLVIDKTAATPARYPRAVGVPARRPL
jgi:16S rRNA (guanine527-N7)-methyltransferase